MNLNKLMSKKHKKVCATLIFIEHFLILGSSITGSISISAVASLVGIPIRITSSAIGLKICVSAIGLKICVITAAVKKYKSIIKKKKEKHDKIELLAKSRLNSTEVLISKTLIESALVRINLF